MSDDEKKAPPESDDSLDGWRGRIDEIDRELLQLLSDRARAAQEIGRIKQARGAATFHVPEREHAVMEKLSRLNEGPLPETAIRSVMREVMSACLALERPLRVSVLGPKGTFSHAAGLRHFGSSSDILLHRGFPEIFDAVERGEADYGVVPIENSTEGVVSQTLDLFTDSSLRIVGEVIVPVSYCLLASGGGLEGIRRVYSHWQALAQCRTWLAAHVPNAEVMECESTAAAAELVRDEPGAAALAGDVAAKLYDLEILASRVEDNLSNQTRFVILGKKEPAPSSNDKTTLMFSVKDEVGILYKILGAFADARINLSKIESRPMKRRAWEYIFFVDLEGHIASPEVAKSVAEVRTSCQFLKVLGSYPRARTPEGGP